MRGGEPGNGRLKNHRVCERSDVYNHPTMAGFQPGNQRLTSAGCSNASAGEFCAARNVTPPREDAGGAKRDVKNSRDQD